ncbi:MAG: BON domain-containing protein [Polyangiales bacterium]
MTRLKLGTIGSLTLAAFGAGAATAFFLDPRSGGRRRALAADRLVHLLHQVQRRIDDRTHDLFHRVEGAVAETRGRFDHRPIDDDVLCERVRAKIGHTCTHPSAIEVHAKGKGIVELRGPILAAERERVLHAVRAIPGVRGIDDDLESRINNEGWWPRHGPRTFS